MKTKLITILGCTLLATSCGGENSDGSDKTTYSSCSITDSGAILQEIEQKILVNAGME